MRERYETLKLPDLRALAKIRGIKSVTTLKKSEIIDAMVALDESEAASAKPVEPKAAEQKKDEKKPVEAKETKNPEH